MSVTVKLSIAVSIWLIALAISRPGYSQTSNPTITLLPPVSDENGRPTSQAQGVSQFSLEQIPAGNSLPARSLALDRPRKYCLGK